MKRKHSSFLSSDNEDELDAFCKLEEALQSDSEDEKGFDPDNLRSELKHKFPDLFSDRPPKGGSVPSPKISPKHSPPAVANEDEYDEMLELSKRLQESYEVVKRKKLELEREQKRFQKERRAFAKERAKFESEQIFANSKPNDSKLREKYDRLKAKYQTKRTEWACEKTLLVGQIEDLRRALRAKESEPVRPAQPSNHTNSIVEIDDDSDSSGIQIKKPEPSKGKSFSDPEIVKAPEPASESDEEVVVEEEAPPAVVKTVFDNEDVSDFFIEDQRDPEFAPSPSTTKKVSLGKNGSESLSASPEKKSAFVRESPVKKSAFVRESPEKKMEYPRIKRNVVRTNDSFEIIDNGTSKAPPVKVIRANIPSPSKARKVESPPKVVSQVTTPQKDQSKLSPVSVQKRKSPVMSPVRPQKGNVRLHDDYDIDFDFEPGPVVREIPGAGGKKTLRYKDGSTATVFSNGTRKMQRNGCTYVFYANGDVSQEFSDKAIAYRYAATRTVELTLPDKSVLYSFENGQREKHFPNGDKAIQYPNGTFRINHANGDYQINHPDGRIEKCTNGRIEVLEQ